MKAILHGNHITSRAEASFSRSLKICVVREYVFWTFKFLELNEKTAVAYIGVQWKKTSPSRDFSAARKNLIMGIGPRSAKVCVNAAPQIRQVPFFTIGSPKITVTGDLGNVMEGRLFPLELRLIQSIVQARAMSRSSRLFQPSRVRALKRLL